jgi:hypothetical protein
VNSSEGGQSQTASNNKLDLPIAIRKLVQKVDPIKNIVTMTIT